MPSDEPEDNEELIDASGNGEPEEAGAPEEEDAISEMPRDEEPAEEDADSGDGDESDGAEAQPADPENEGENADADAGDDDGETGSDDDVEAESGDADAPKLPLISVVEAVLFAAREPLKLQHIARAVGKGTRQEAVREAVDELNVHYLETSRAFEIAEISGRFQLMSRPEFVGHIMKIYPKKELVEKDKSSRLTPAALDTLAIIAYKQPVTRGDIEHIRGVGCGPVLKALIERGSVRVAGKRTDLVGQPLMYGTTEAFLAEFGLGSIEELPLRSEFLGMLGESAPMAPETSGDEEAAEARAETGFVIVPTPEPEAPDADPSAVDTMAEEEDAAPKADDEPEEAPAEEAATPETSRMDDDPEESDPQPTL